jgi:threonyl-tRNA synthetase
MRRQALRPRKLGRELDLFTSGGGPRPHFLAPKGWAIWQAVELRMRGVYRDNGYQEIKAPQIWIARCGRVRPLGKYRENVHDGVGEPVLRAQADELPGSRPDL